MVASAPGLASTTKIKKKGVTIGGLQCDKVQTGTVFYSSDASKKYPLLSFMHGWTEGGKLTDVNYKDVLESVAAAGYVVVAQHSGTEKECQKIYPKDQQRTIAYIKETEEFASKVDWNSTVGIYGHSMGGGATGDNAGDENAIKTYNIGAAVLLHPVGGHLLCKGCPFIVRKIHPTKIPTFYATGSADTICQPHTCEAWSTLPGTAAPFIFAEMKGADHFECQSEWKGSPCPHGWTNYVINWFNCHLKGMQEECAAANNVCKSPTKPMTKTNCQPGANSSLVVV